MPRSKGSTTTVSVELLRELSLFAGLSDEQLSRIVPLGRVRDVPAEEPLITQGEFAADPYIVLDGKLSLCVGLGGGVEYCMLTMTHGEIIGWSALLEDKTWLASSTAVKDSRVLVIDGKALRELCESDHDTGYFVMRNLFSSVASRLHDTRLQLIDMYGHE